MIGEIPTSGISDSSAEHSGNFEDTRELGSLYEKRLEIRAGIGGRRIRSLDG